MRRWCGARRSIARDGLMIDANHGVFGGGAIALGGAGGPDPVVRGAGVAADLRSHREVKRRITIPIAGGECEYTRFGFEPLLRRRAVDYAQPDLCACGGISEGMKIATLASIYGVHVTPHAWGSAVGLAAALHFYAALPGPPATLTPAEKLLEYDRTENPFRTELVEEPIQFEQGRLWLPRGSGLGVRVLEDKLRF
jgi:D-galactarolactone cycloisomerase